MTPNQIAAKAREMIATDPQAEREMRAEWAQVEERITANIAALVTNMPNYWRSDLHQKARLAMLTAFVEGKTPAECAAAALAAIDAHPTSRGGAS